MATTVAELVARLTADTSSFRSELAGATQATQSSFGKIQAAGKRFGQTMLTGVGIGSGLLAVQSIGRGIGVVFDELKQSQTVAAQTNAAIKSTGGAANVTAKDIDQLGTSLMRVSGMDDELVKSGANLLLTFKSVRNEAGKGNDIFNQATKTAVDLSVAFHKDLNSSVILLGKALEDPIRGLTSLRRVGVQFTEDQEAMIKQLVESGDQLGAQRLILAELETQVGGSAKAYGETFAGQVDRAKEALKNMGADILAAVMPVLEQMTQAVIGLVGWFNEHEEAAKLLAYALGTLAVAAFAAFTASAVASAAATIAAWAPVLAILGGILATLQAIKRFKDSPGNFLKDPLNTGLDPLGFVPDITPWKGLLPFASGGVVTKPTAALIGESGPEAVVPLDRMGGFGGGGTDVVQLVVDGRVLAEVVRPHALRDQSQGRRWVA